MAAQSLETRRLTDRVHALSMEVTMLRTQLCQQLRDACTSQAVTPAQAIAARGSGYVKDGKTMTPWNATAAPLSQPPLVVPLAAILATLNALSNSTVASVERSRRRDRVTASRDDAPVAVASVPPAAAAAGPSAVQPDQAPHLMPPAVVPVGEPVLPTALPPQAACHGASTSRTSEFGTDSVDSSRQTAAAADTMLPEPEDASSVPSTETTVGEANHEVIPVESCKLASDEAADAPPLPAATPTASAVSAMGPPRSPSASPLVVAARSPKHPPSQPSGLPATTGGVHQLASRLFSAAAAAAKRQREFLVEVTNQHPAIATTHNASHFDPVASVEGDLLRPAKCRSI